MSGKQPSILSFFHKNASTQDLNNSDQEASSPLSGEPDQEQISIDNDDLFGPEIGQWSPPPELPQQSLHYHTAAAVHIAAAEGVEGLGAGVVAGGDVNGAGAEGPVHGVGGKQVKWANTREIMSLAEICQNVQNWYDPNYGDDISGNRSTVLARKQRLAPTFQKEFPDALIIKVSDILKFSPQHFEAGELFEEH